VDLHPSPPLADTDYDFTRCSEILFPRSPYVEFLDPKPAAAVNAIYTSIPVVPTHTHAPPNALPHINATQTTLNLNPDGSPLTYRSTHKGPNSSEWRRMDGDEIARLIDSGTMSAIARSDCPQNRFPDITYYNPKPKEKYNAVTDQITRRIRGTIGGDRINYPG
jgi:hypothetical protein